MEQNIKIKRDINMIRNIHPLKNHKMCRTKHNNFTFIMHCFLNIECLDAYFCQHCLRLLTELAPKLLRARQMYTHKPYHRYIEHA